MPFECKKYHHICQARCCGIIPIPRVTWQKNQHNIQRPIEATHLVETTDLENEKVRCILPITPDALCPFLKEDYSCAIYKDRPKVCQQFGDETHWALRCPMQHKDGTPRSEEDKIVLNSKVDEWVQKHANCAKRLRVIN